MKLGIHPIGGTMASHHAGSWRVAVPLGAGALATMFVTVATTLAPAADYLPHTNLRVAAPTTEMTPRTTGKIAVAKPTVTATPCPARATLPCLG